jgi:type I restriction enzyme S subunit
MVPNGWKLGTIEEISSVSSGGTPSRKNESYWNGNIPWVTTAEVKFNIIEDTAEKITEEGLANSSAKLFPVDTILIAMYGQGKTRGQVAKLGIEASTNQACAAIILKAGYHVDYYYQFLISQYDNIREMANGGGQENLSGGIVKSIKVPVPPLPEQNKIAQILSTWDKAISTTEQLLANSQQQKKSLMQQLLAGKKRLCGYSEPFKRYHFSDLLKIDSKSLGTKTEPDFEFDYISLSDVELGKIGSALEHHIYKSAPSRARRIVKAGDILLSTVRPNLQGFARIYNHHEHCIASTGFAILTPKNGTYGDYIYHYLFSAHITGQINALVVGTNYPAINSSDVAGLCIYCPSYDEQVRIAEILNNSDTTINIYQQKLDALKQEKKALMQQLLTGKRRVKVEEAA